MDSIISLVIFAGIYAIVYVIKAAFAGKAGVEVEPVTDEEYSGEEYQPVEYEEPVPYVEPVAKPKKVTKAKAKPKKNVLNEGVRTTTAVPVQQEAPVKEKKERISLKDTSDAKRAFIYSEVFNRKY